LNIHAWIDEDQQTTFGRAKKIVDSILSQENATVLSKSTINSLETIYERAKKSIS